MSVEYFRKALVDNANFIVAFVICFLIIFINNSCYCWPVKSYQELRYRFVKGQKSTNSCGTASLATLFSDFYGMEIEENKIIDLILPYLEEEKERLKKGEIPEGGVSMLDIKKVSEKLGISAKGYQLPKESFISLLKRLKSPVIIHLSKPNEHFVLAIDSIAKQVIVGDPSWGIRLFSRKELTKKWEGLMLAFAVSNSHTEKASTVISSLKNKLICRRKLQDFALNFFWNVGK